MTAPVLEASSASKVFDSNGRRVFALDAIDLAVDRGEFVVLLGPSGCGKSTLLNLFAGLTSPTTGEVFHNGQLVLGPPDGVGYVFQQPTLLPWRNVEANVALPLEARGEDREERRRRVIELLELVGLSDFAENSPFQLSGGMQQRVALARGLVHDPDVLLMDEPFGALDAITREQLNLELERIWRVKGMTVVLVTHDIAEAVFLADRVVVLGARPGRIRHTQEIPLARPRTSELLSTPAFAELTGELRRWIEGR